MSDDCCSSSCATAAVSPRFRRALWVALVVNAAMFAVEFSTGLHSGSVSLLADALDFLGDAINYALTLIALAMLPVWRSRAAMVKGLTMGAYGLFVLAQTGWHAISGSMPEAATMGLVASLALAANASIAVLLYAFREGDANMRSVWLCSRNDAIGNVAVMLAAAGVFGTGSAWPDLLVALIMAILGLTAARSVIAQATHELKESAHVVRA